MRSNIKTASMLLLVAILAIGFVGSASAQGRGAQQTPAEQKAAFDKNFSELTVSLVLTEEQGPKVKEVLWTAQEKRTKMMADMRASGGQGRGEMRQKMSKMNEETMTALADVLTADQLKKYGEIQAAQQQGGQGRRPGAGNPQ